MNNSTIGISELSPQLKGCKAKETFFADTNGNVALCDFLAVTSPFILCGTTTQNAPVIFGNIYTEEPIDIYRSQAFENFRRAHRKGNELPLQCQNCIEAYGLMCSNRTTRFAEYLLNIFGFKCLITLQNIWPFYFVRGTMQRVV